MDPLFLYFYIHAKLWNSIDGVLSRNNLCLEVGYMNDMFQAVAFTITITLFGMVFSIPFQIYKTFWIEEKYGFNKTTARTFAVDQVKAFILGSILQLLLVPCLLWVV